MCVMCELCEMFVSAKFLIGISNVVPTTIRDCTKCQINLCQCST